MAKRRKIGLIYQYNENWIGGTYYIENLIAALGRLPNKLKPKLLIFTDEYSEFEHLKKKVNYPFLKSRDYIRTLSLRQRVINKISRTIFKKVVYDYFHHDIDLVFPATSYYKFHTDQQFLFWIPDFQEHYLPEFFSASEIESRKTNQQYIVDNGQNIVFSSHTSKFHFNEIYPGNKLKQFVLQFAVSHPPVSAPENICAKYDLPAQFFICSNQFWQHKNHQVVLKAVGLLKRLGKKISIAFTGKEHDYRYPEYYNELLQLVKELKIEEEVKFLGFIAREDQLVLIKTATAVIQPSLFEGWSTVIEDAKTLGATVIASDLPVHKEQLLEYMNNALFPPDNETALAEKMISVKESKEAQPRYNYDKDVYNYGQNFINIVKSIRSKRNEVFNH